MSSKSTNFSFAFWDGGSNYKQHDVINGVNSSQDAYYYATQDNTNQYPLSTWSISITSWSRIDNIVTINLSTPITPPLTQGSFITTSITGGFAYTGCCIDGNSISAKYFNPGPDSVGGLLTGTISSTLNPAWTTGFGWIPSYDTSFENNFRTIEAKMGDGYSQRQRNGINSIQNVYNLTFAGRSDREVRAITNYIQEKNNVDPIKINTVTSLQGDNYIQYICSSLKVSHKSKNINDLTVTATQVFDTL